MPNWSDSNKIIGSIYILHSGVAKGGQRGRSAPGGTFQGAAFQENFWIKFEKDGVQIGDCRGQVFDNAAAIAVYFRSLVRSFFHNSQN